MTKPFFSIVIPSFNRCQLLKATIAITLGQTFRDFELIISDNASMDETNTVVNSFKDQRIKYFRNPKNIGAEPNYKKALSYASGEYLFTQGDDDLILFDDTLEKVKQILDKRPWGFIRLNFLEKTLDGEGLRKSFITQEKDFSLKSHSPPEKIFEFFSQTATSHLAGLVIRNKKNFSDGLIDCQDTPWVKPLFDIVKNDGALFLAKEYMVISWCRIGDQTGVSHYYDVKDNRLMFEDYTDVVFREIPASEPAAFKENFYHRFIMLQPVIKLYSDNRNLIKFDRRLLQLEPRLKRNSFFWLMIVVAFIVPKFVWEIVRVIQHRQKNFLDKLDNKNLIEKRFAFIKKTYYS